MTQVRLPPLPIPRSKSYDANSTRYGQARTDVAQCLICNKPVSSKSFKVVVLDDGCGKIIDPKSSEAQGENNGGCFFIGPECWRSNPELHAYEVKE